MLTPLVIDLSHHQVIPQSLELAKQSGIAGVIHKVSEGLTISDDKAKARMSLARNVGMLWGVYHFLRPGNILEQADRFLSHHEIIDEETLLVCDFEVGGISLDEVLAFLEHIEQVSGQKPVLYSGHTLKELGAARMRPKLAEYRLWICQYNAGGPTLPKGYKNWWLWQYSETGRIPGITGNVDLNAYQGGAAELATDWVIRTDS